MGRLYQTTGWKYSSVFPSAKPFSGFERFQADTRSGDWNSPDLMLHGSMVFQCFNYGHCLHVSPICLEYCERS